MMDTDGGIDYSGYTLEELIEARSSINKTNYPKNYSNLCKAIEAHRRDLEFDTPMEEQSEFADTTFEISVPLYRWYFWVILVAILMSDFISLFGFFSSGTGLSSFMVIAALAGVALKLAILWTLLTKAGPFETLVYIWGGLMVASGILGLLAFAATEGAIPISQYVDKVIFIGLGLSLVVPLGWCVRRPATTV